MGGARQVGGERNASATPLYETEHGDARPSCMIVSYVSVFGLR